LIVGLGVGIVETQRFRAAEARFGRRLHDRLFTPRERAYAARRPPGTESLAVRFAAKLAARRALGGQGAAWHDLEVLRRRGAAPTLVFHAQARRLARARRAERAALSMTHDAQICVAQVVLETGR
jgi:holo-[acyl-carrier protein] synthase